MVLDVACEHVFEIINSHSSYEKTMATFVVSVVLIDVLAWLGIGTSTGTMMTEIECNIWRVYSLRLGEAYMPQWTGSTQVQIAACGPYRAKSLPKSMLIQIARFMWPTWGPHGSERTQVGPMLAPWTLLSAYVSLVEHLGIHFNEFLFKIQRG